MPARLQFPGGAGQEQIAGQTLGVAHVRVARLRGARALARHSCVFAERLMPIESPFGLIASIKDADAAIAFMHLAERVFEIDFGSISQSGPRSTLTTWIGTS
jgi:hypothetical protein